MRKLLISLVAVAALGAGTAVAQSGFWAGLSGGYPGAQVHFGVENVFAGIDVRANVGYNFFGTPSIGLGLDALYGLDVDTAGLPIGVYIGGGPSFTIADGDLGAGVMAFVGGEYGLGDLGIPELSVFVEVGPALQFRTGEDIEGFELGFDFVGRVGVNYRF